MATSDVARLCDVKLAYGGQLVAKNRKMMREKSWRTVENVLKCECEIWEMSQKMCQKSVGT